MREARNTKDDLDGDRLGAQSPWGKEHDASTGVDSVVGKAPRLRRFTRDPLHNSYNRESLLVGWGSCHRVCPWGTQPCFGVAALREAIRGPD
ncbi:hypothetical protein BHM03_00061809 [Ensete ventricosum]|nr:hypothetical protein BHM03_00061809 [Ensete ventricosum]